MKKRKTVTKKTTKLPEWPQTKGPSLSFRCEQQERVIDQLHKSLQEARMEAIDLSSEVELARSTIAKLRALGENREERFIRLRAAVDFLAMVAKP